MGFIKIEVVFKRIKEIYKQKFDFMFTKQVS